MGLSIHPDHLFRYGRIARLLFKYGRSDWAQSLGFDKLEPREAPTPASGEDARHGEELARDLEAMGPTFVKIGQLLSSRADLLPPVYLEALSRLQDRVDPFPYEQVEQIVAAELGVRVSRAFQKFEQRPLAAASLGQVHRAILRSGRPVAVKVQRPDIRGQISGDLDALDEIAEFLERHTELGRRYGLQRIVAEFRRTLLSELDYRLEAANLREVSENLRDFENIVIPRPIDDYCAERVLTMDEVVGTKITDLDPSVLLEVDRAQLAEELFRAYLKQVLIDGIFHADPHPGNVHLTRDGRLALLDLGMVARVAPSVQLELVKLLLAVSEGRGEDAAEVVMRMEENGAPGDRALFRSRVGEFVRRHQGAQIHTLRTGRMVLEIQRIAGEAGVPMPDSFLMLGKALFSLDRVAIVLDPHFDPNESFRRNLTEVILRRLSRRSTWGGLFQGAIETGELVQKLPRRLNTIMDKLSAPDFKITIDAIDEEHLLKGLHKIANRIAAGLVLAALIIGAALLMRVETSYTLFGYPALPIVLFSAAAAVGFFLITRVMVLDPRHEREVRHLKKPNHRP